MRTHQLTELETLAGVPLTPKERDGIRAAIPSLTISSTRGEQERYDLRPSGTIGVVRVGDLQVEIRPKLPVDRVLFLLSYALDPKAWRADHTEVEPDTHLIEAIVPPFASYVRRVLRHGLLHGYRGVEETHTTIRGRIRLADQLRARPGIHLPVELAYDEFSIDVLENQLLAAAIERLLRLPMRHRSTRRTLVELREQFAGVDAGAVVERPVPEPTWTRLNERYRPAVGLARLILDGAALDARAGAVHADGVLLDMPAVFENFVIAALREQLGVSARAFPQGGAGRGLRLDEERSVKLKPDLSWWVGNRCVFVGDCKYKRVKSEGLHNADLYQLLAYLVALDLDEGLLVYAAGERTARTRTVVHAGKRLSVVTLDLAGEPRLILGEIEQLASRVTRLAAAASGRSAPPAAGAPRAMGMPSKADHR